MLMKLRSFTLLPLVTALAAACSKTPEPSPTPAPEQASPGVTAPASASRAAAPTPAAAPQAGGEVAWDVPASWEVAPNKSAMRKATYKIKRAEGDAEDGDVSVTQAGGSVDANIERWSGQFTKQAAGSPKRSELTVNNLKVSQVEIHGTVSGSGMMPGMPAGEPKEGFALLGAIVTLPTGGLWFFKLTGPEKTVAAAKADFDKLVKSLRLK